MARATAQRPDWSALPASLRLAIEDRCGSEVVEATSQGGGFTNGFASRLLLADGARVFVKAAPQDTWIAGSYRQESEVVSTLPPGGTRPNAAR